MSCFTRVLEKSKEYGKTLSAVRGGRLPMGVLGLSNVHKAHYISAICEQTEKTALIICPDEAQATKLVSDLNGFSFGAYLYPVRDFNFVTAESQSREFEQKRLGVLAKIIRGEYKYIVCSLPAAVQLTIPFEELKKRSVLLKRNESPGLEKSMNALINAGYVRCDTVDGAGQFAVRGGILDFFPSHCERPVRVEFWGDSIDLMTYFDIESQRRTDIIDEIEIIPAAEILFPSDEILLEKIKEFAQGVKGRGSVNVKKKLGEDIDRLESGVSLGSLDKYLSLAYENPETIFDYTYDSLLFVSESFSCKTRLNDYTNRFNEDVKLFFEDGSLTKGLDRFNISFSDVLKKYTDMGAVYLDNLSRGSFDTPVRELVSVRAQQNAIWDGALSSLLDDLRPVLKRNYTCVVFAGTEKAAKELCYDLESADIKSIYFPVRPAEFPQGQVSVISGALSAGLEYNDLKFTVVTYGRSFTAESRKKRKKTIQQGRSIHSLEELHKGDYIVHATHGIGIFDGIHKMQIGGVTKDYIKIQYAKQDVLMIPVTQLDMVAKYISPGGENRNVKINRLGTGDWQKTRSRVKGAVKDMAAQLTKLYSKRLNSKGFAFSPDIDMQSDFERRFEFDETDDQLTAISEIKRDMERPFPMDRLLCGDVGFGKTEVALRAVFKCVADGKQCAILVPTTILSFQHYQTILKRFDGFPVEIEMLSRFRTPAEREKIKKGLRRGSIDIVVGTHSLIAAKVEFKDLGLLVIDEEQRFGVAQKEKLKERFPCVDVLTLSATPIPRTLNMAMSGIRDMSILEDPPRDRHPVQTYVIEHDMGILAQAIDREMRRGGQVYYLHNRVDDIERTAAKIKELLPEVRIGIGHGKMSEAELSEVWRRLLEGEIDVLVCTTIIETGVDVPNANTLIIEDADKMGLAQLHQIRGRVGRSARRAFAYLTFRPNKELSEEAQRRLNAIREYTQFGSGFQIAMRDLEIRGAGNVLGAEQHGHLAAVGYDMYLQLLSMAVEEEKGEKTGEKVKMDEKECLIDLHVDAYIPEKYIPAMNNRLYMYKRIADIKSEDDASDVIDELCDRFGDPPAAVTGLIDVCLLRNSATDLGIYEIAQRNGALLLYSDNIDMQKVGRMSLILRGRIMVNASVKPYISVKIAPGQRPIDALKQVIKILKV